MRAAIDPHTRGLVTVDPSAYSVHRGVRFKASYLVAHGSELANDAAIDILVKVGARHIHAVPRIAAGGDCDVLMYSGTTTGSAGTPISAVEKNQTASRASDTAVFSAPTVGVTGTVLWSQFVPGGKKGPGIPWSESQWILKSNTNYMFRITNRSGGAIQLSFSIGWMEE